jgi:hypothetical protein
MEEPARAQYRARESRFDPLPEPRTPSLVFRINDTGYVWHEWAAARKKKKSSLIKMAFAIRPPCQAGGVAG